MTETLAVSTKLQNVLAGGAITPPPVWMMRQAGRYLPEYQKIRRQHPNFIEFCFSPESAAEVTLQPIRRFDFDAAIVFADILLLPHVVGATVTFVPGDGPTLSPLRVERDIDLLDWDRAAEGLSPVGETLARVRADLSNEKSLIGFAGAPWTVATYMLGGGKGEAGRRDAKAWAWSNLELADRLLSQLADATADYLAAQIRAGADTLKLFESWAEGLPDPAFDRWVISPTKRILERLRFKGVSAPVIGFPRGASEHQLARFTKQTGISALALDMAQANHQTLESLPQSLPVQGSLDPAVLVAGGAALVDETKRLLDLFAQRPYVFNLGHGIWPSTPIEHVQLVIDTVRAWRST